MVEVKELVRQASDLRARAVREADPDIRDRLNRMADTYSRRAEAQARAAPARSSAADDSDEAPSAATMKQTNEPWKQPVEKEQDPGHVSADDLERWQKSSTH